MSQAVAEPEPMEALDADDGTVVPRGQGKRLANAVRMYATQGQLRPLQVRDHSVTTDVPVAEKADRSNNRHVPAPFAGVVTLQVAEGDTVSPGQPVATIEAMKMEANITAPRAGTVTRLAITDVQQVEGGDLIMELRSP